MEKEKTLEREEMLSPPDVGKQKKSIDPMVILAIIIVIAAIATWLIPAGSFDRIAVKGADYDKIDMDSFRFAAQKPLGWFDLFMSFTKGLQGAGDIIFFLLIMGGVFQVVEYTGALHAGLSNLVIKLKGKEMLLVPVSIFLFSLISATAACCEEYLAFLPLMYIICVAVGFDSITAVALLFVSSAVGYAGGMMNAFTVGVAQNIAGLGMFSGMWYRWIVWAVLAALTSIMVMRHARMVKNHPERNEMLEIDRKYAEQLDLGEVQPMTRREVLILAVFAGAFVAVAFCIIKLHFYIDEMSAIFLIVMVLVAVIGKIRPSTVAEQFVKGCSNLLWAALIIGMCKAVTNILTDAGIMDTMVWAMGNLLQDLPHSVTASGMFVLQDLLNIMIPSGSGQAAVTMPFMAPLSDVLGLNRQVAVLAFQMGDAFTNVVTPTSGELMAALAICHVPYKKWFRFLAPIWAVWAVAACAFLIIAVQIGYH